MTSFSLLTAQTEDPEKRTIRLPEPNLEGALSLEATLKTRRSFRNFKRKEALNLAETGQLLWSAQGITDSKGGRTAPSAGALYPLEIYLVAGNVEGMLPGVYKYIPEGHKLRRRIEGDLRRDLYNQALQQDWIADAPAVIVIAGVYSRTMAKYGERGKRYVHIEVGHAAQNIYLQAEAMGLGTVAVGAFQDEPVRELMEMPPAEYPLLLMPVGKK